MNLLRSQLHWETLFPENDQTMTERVVQRLGQLVAQWCSPGAAPLLQAPRTLTCWFYSWCLSAHPQFLAHNATDENLEGCADRPSVWELVAGNIRLSSSLWLLFYPDLHCVMLDCRVYWKDMASRDWYKNEKPIAKWFSPWFHPGTGGTHFHAAERSPDPSDAYVCPWLWRGDDLFLARCVVSSVIGEIWLKDTCKHSKYVPANPCRWCWRWCAVGTEGAGDKFQVLLFLLCGRGMPSLLGCHLCFPSRAQQAAAEQKANRNMWETDILCLGNVSSSPK